MKYTAISIGPIIKTLAMARKPRELWAASYLFSYLMKCIYTAAEDAEAKIISPAKLTEEKYEVGIYPDRIYIKNECNVKEIIKNAKDYFYNTLIAESILKEKKDLDLKKKFFNYFNIMTACCEKEKEKESEAIAELNRKLDVMELWNFATADSNADQIIYNIISKKKNELLYKLATGKDEFPFETIEDIAKAQIGKDAKIKYSHHKYFCIVQADGDNVGKTVSHKDLEDDEVLKISEALVEFGIEASKRIKRFGGVPIYAGGDDLLFIAPVIGIGGANIFELIKDIEDEDFKGVHDEVSELKDNKGNHLKDEDGNKIEASLSFGISISYYKHPLYEALATARKQLFNVAKEIKNKNKDVKEKKAVAWTLRKHSGGTFSASFSRNNNDLQEKFKDLITKTTDEATVSAVAHKIRQFESLIYIVLKSEQESNEKKRLNALFKNVLHASDEKKSYFDAVKALMPIVFEIVKEKENSPEKEKEKENFTKTLYCLLRTAKFIKGEELRNE